MLLPLYHMLLPLCHVLLPAPCQVADTGATYDSITLTKPPSWQLNTTLRKQQLAAAKAYVNPTYPDPTLPYATFPVDNLLKGFGAALVSGVAQNLVGDNVKKLFGPGTATYALVSKPLGSVEFNITRCVWGGSASRWTRLSSTSLGVCGRGQQAAGLG